MYGLGLLEGTLFITQSRAHLVDEEIEEQMTSHGHKGYQRKVYIPNRLTLNTAFLQKHVAPPHGWTLKLSVGNMTPLPPFSWL